MKKLMMLMLAFGFVTVTPAHAEVGKDKTAPNCQQVIQSIQQQLKSSRPAAQPDAQTGTGATGTGSSAQ